MHPIETQILSVLEKRDADMRNSPNIIRFENACTNFESLVKRGVTHKRGYNLLSINMLNRYSIDSINQFSS